MKQGYRLFAAVIVFLASTFSSAQGAFEVTDIRLEGLQRVAPGLVFRHFPISNGEQVDEQRLSTAVRKLFASGYFDDVKLARENGVLILKLRERPSIALIRLEGNKALKKEQLLEGLKQGGLKEGDVFKRATLEQIQQDLVRIYAAQGRYGAQVDAEVENLPGNRVALNIEIKEGKVASIQHINIVGNELFDDETLKKQFELQLPGFWSFYTDDDRYAREKLAGDLERLRSFYMDQGYIKFSIDSTQVSITPDKKHVYITVNITEGEKYSVRDVNLAGEMVVPEEELMQVITVKAGDTFSRNRMVKSQEALNRKLGNVGYMFANVAPSPEIHDDNTVTLNYFLDPGKRTYVRRIVIRGNTRTSDEVIRREMRQMEAGVASTKNIDASKLRLERTGFFSTVNVETIPVPGTSDQVDLEYTVVEQQSGSFSASVGFSQGSGLILGLSVEQDNFLGSGRKVAFGITNSDSTTEYRFSSNDPYYTVDGVSRGYKLYYRERDFDEDDVSSYETDELGAGVNFGYPIDEFQRLNFGATLEQTGLKTNSTTPQEIIDFVADEGDDYLGLVGNVSWSDNHLNRGVFPTDGYVQNASLELGLPGSDLTYYKARYSLRMYQPLTESERWVGKVWTRIGYADDLGGNQYPFFKHFFAGGIRSVRGFEANSLGPKDTPRNGASADPFGGNILLTGGLELIVPTPFAEGNSTRTSLFLDAGNVFDTSCGASATNCEEGIEFDEIRYTTGLAFSWITPMGPLTFVLATPLNEESGDDTELFQFSFGRTF
ncbi:outer membrane protein assembly factor BamA [Pontibacterium granulatum]|uniref:outer membrane protein assembly factor BamA n=1 Tax=Pontibacterium granulatum TaxID=2036029 RepID=UPI00249AE2C4|nr:outer membrane protein assembly factor BamA [Pontibacterium granulatum]MDI3322959.1 outer membrane protein assembly factor BamA [Pontibacterium granulatum]